ncbi:hypothetical protein [Pelotomaculum propionicicum]|uniref:Uncharacterized protein n=1 Tax=Pelotomaculum propionicicum TaxID=258475 RepID=A0A4Y7RLI3_9FIRM|nr:hypothetical protein [Pelotomaculum propionicicum]NLI12933.1 hypothetical protein [Peptococcaceae bacterium]TEB09835.1 hypothetical protein Pmgp_02836 [Pelotomaculum propionicicum]
MTNRACDECPVKDLQRVHRLLEKRALAKMPQEVREPLLEAKKQMRLALRRLIGHALGGEETGESKCRNKSRQIRLD